MAGDAEGSRPGCSFLLPTPRVQQLLGLPAPLLANTITPREMQTASLCTRDATLLGEPCVPRLRQVRYAGVGLSCCANGGRGVLKLLGQVLHGTRPCISTQEILDRNTGVIAF